MEKHTIIFDLDDTLSYCNKYYAERVEMFVEEMSRIFPGVSKKELRNKVRKFDIKGVEKHGLSVERFPTAFVEAYTYFCDKENIPVNEVYKNKLYNIAKSVFDVEVEPFPNSYDVLDALKDCGHQLALYTGGNEEVQLKKVETLGLGPYFEDRIFITENKDVYFMKKVIRDLGSNPCGTWMIGNSLRTDIYPAVKNNIGAIYIPGEKDWGFNDYEVDKDTFITLQSLDEVPEFFEDVSLRHIC